MSDKIPNSRSSPLPWWTWILPLFIFQFGTQASLIFKYMPASAVFYIPTAFGIVLINWWGPRVLPALYLNALLSCGLWDLPDYWSWPVYAIPETLFVFLSWLFYTKTGKGKYWLPDVNNTLKFIVLGIILPLLIYMPVLKLISLIYGNLKIDDLQRVFTVSFLGDYLSHMSLGIPVLVYFTNYFEKRRLTYNTGSLQISEYSFQSLNFLKKIELLIIYILLTLASFLLNFSENWFFFGILSLYVAIRFGFYHVIIANVIVIFLNYFLPAIIHTLMHINWVNDEYLIDVNLGLGLMFTFAIITGRLISDLWSAQKQINKQFQDLQRTNSELDKFVYSVSHDLSAPLKSILGLINLSKIDRKSGNTEIYFEKIESSVNKLNEFIRDILSYSRNARTDLEITAINVESVIDEIIENLRYLDNFNKIKIIRDNLNIKDFISDKIRLKIILTNLISNAIKFHNLDQPSPEIHISIETEENLIRIIVSDNGSGIPDEYQDKIFEMFFRGTVTTPGSGLGLYIARESSERIKGNLTVNSKPGNGSLFTLTLPKDISNRI